jgi:pimeloyl-ACP methyl ester carboxylesterase
MTDGPSAALRRTTVVADDCALAAWSSEASGPPILFVHGYPDTHAVWDLVIDQLATEFRCLTYDVRGAGASDAPASQDGYRLSALRRDVASVIDQLSPDQPVHLVGHDWGSVQGWDAVLHEKSGRIASYTTISGPCLQHAAAFVHSAKHAGWGPRSGGWTKKREALAQAARFWYIYAFQVPKAPEVVVRALTTRLIAATGERGSHFGPTLPQDAVNGLNLYRANFSHSERLAGGPFTQFPVQLIIPLRDRYVTPALTRNVARFASDLTRVEIDAGHWVMQTRPDEVAGLIADFVRAHSARSG